MKTIRSLMTLAGLSLVLFALSATGAKAQVLESASFSGNFTLPVAAQWGRMTLPAGEYTLSYNGETHIVAVAGKEDGNVRGMVIVVANTDPSAKKDGLECTRSGDALIVHRLEMPELGTAAVFSMPHGAKLVARNHNHKGHTQLAEAPMLFERISVTQVAK